MEKEKGKSDQNDCFSLLVVRRATKPLIVAKYQQVKPLF